MESSFKVYELKNGLKIVHEKVKGFQGWSLGYWVPFGTRHEYLNQRGYAHFLEHMFFKGTARRNASQIAEEVESLGGDFNAFTARDHTCFEMSGLNGDFKKIVPVLTDVILNSKFDSKEISREKKVVLQEIAMVDDSHEDLAFDFFYEQRFKLGKVKVGLGSPILGKAQSIKKLTRKELLKFKDRIYVPEKSVVVIVGDCKERDILKSFRCLEKLSSNKLIEGRQEKDLVIERGGKFYKFWKSDQIYLILGFKAPSVYGENRYIAAVLNHFLGGGMSSLLFQNVREKAALAYNTYSSYNPYEDCGLIQLVAATGADQALQCLKLMKKQVQIMAQKKISSKQMMQIQKNMIAGLMLGQDNLDARMLASARNMSFFGTPLSTQSVIHAVLSVKAAQIQQMAESWIELERQGLWTETAFGNTKDKSFEKSLKKLGWKSVS